MYPKLSLLIFLSFSALSGLYSQGIKCNQYKIESVIQLDTLPVEESSISLNQQLNFKFDPQRNALLFSESSSLDSVEICFRTISPDLLKAQYVRSINTYSRGRVSRLPTASSIPIIPKEEIFSFTDFESFGAITRGVSFGNRQNVFVNSALNLQLEGQLSEDLYVSASITDQNIPYQPEGNTQQIRDFDNVFIKLYNKRFDITAGDVVLTNRVKEGYFLKYYKNVQGLNLNYKYDLNDKWKATSSLSGSAAKGQFSSASLEPIEGVQGPYRLRGPNGERFIIVLANSERVFIDGQLMERGFDRDYVIDYNLGEVTFSNSVLITRFTRIRIDFEYAEQFYSRTNVNTSQEIWNDKTKFYLNFYQEKDNTTSTLGFDISDNDLGALQALGDNQGSGIIDGTEQVGFIEDAILYFKKDTLIGATSYQILEYTTDADIAEFKSSFTEVGFGNGNYIRQSSTSNGNIYSWVAPQNGQPQGIYEPIRIVPLPNKKQMFVLGNSTKINHFESFGQEVAISNQDQNLYSGLNDNDNVGYAYRVNVNSQGRKFGSYAMKSNFSFEWVNDEFEWVDRFRTIEYDRNWGYNLTLDTVDRTDRILKGSLSFQKDQNNFLDIKYSYRSRTNVVKGSQFDFKLNKTLGPFLSRTSFYQMSNNPLYVQSDWLRFKQDIRLNTWSIKPGYSYELDHQKTSIRDTLTSSLMYFHMHNFYIETSDSSNTKFRFDYIKRVDQIPDDGEIEPYTDADEFRLRMNINFLNSQKFTVTGNYRKVNNKLIDSNDENLLGKVDWSGSFFDKHVRQMFSFSTANTRELRRSFIYILVPTGEGTHTWRDENADGIQDLNEFYEAINADEKNYAKIFTPTDEYINAFQSTLLHNLDANLPKRWSSGGVILKTISKLSFNSNVRLNYKSTDNSLSNRLNPFKQNLDDIEVISSQNQKRFSLFYNQNGSGLAMDLNRTNNERKSLLSNGFEIREKEDWATNIRVTLSQGFIVRFQGSLGTTKNESDFLDSRNFNLSRQTMTPELIWQPVNTFRVSGKISLRNKTQKQTEASRHSSITDYSLESTLIRSGKGNLNAQLQWLSIQFEGDRNTFLGYELLEGLQPGQNQKWNFNWQQSLNKGLQLTIQYNGRKSSGTRPIHTGTMQLTAFF